ncbi:MAG: VCBS repeat-containing protein [Candidatus Dadabacteria bacterium]
MKTKVAFPNSCSVFYVIILLLFISCNTKPKLFESLPSSKTHVSFENKVQNQHLFNILYYLYFYNGGGVATGDINNDGLPDIYFTANSKGNNKLYLNKGNFQFEDITAKAGVGGGADWCTGVTMADVNGDGFLDIYVSAVAGEHGLKGNNQLFINNGNNTFTDRSRQYGLDFSGFTTQSIFFDYDHDGDLDCYILNQSHRPNANIVDTSNRRKFDPLAGDRFYRNDLNTTGRFTDVSQQAGIYQSNLGYGLGIAVSDLNNDGWDDIYVGNDFHENDYYYINNGNGTFTESGAKHFRHYSRFSMGNDIADYNNDGQPDVITVDMLPPDEKTLKTYGSDENPEIYKVKLEMNGFQYQYSKNCLQRNNGNGESFSETGLISGVSATDWSWAPLFADFDNDGNKDLFVSSGIVKRPVDLDYVHFASNLKNRGMDRTDRFDDEAIDSMPDGSSHPFFFRGSGSNDFKEVSEEWGTGKMKGYFNGASYADLDNDGNLDLVINAINAPATILKNTAPKKHFVSLSFTGDSLNRFGVGCKAWVFQHGKMQYQELMLTRGFQSSCEPRLHFGLDTTALIDSLLVVWPGQEYQLIKNIKGDKQLVINKSNAAGSFVYNNFFPPGQSLFEDVSAQVKCNWRHRENPFFDFNVQYLIPHEESTRGPKIAVGDVNKDGLDDFYVCGARGQAGALIVQQKDGTFLSTDSALFNRFAVCEDVDARFFDANGDGYPDLWVVSGGNEMPVNDISSADRLYLNDGKGHFNVSLKSIPQLYENKSCISVADIDKDGDMDVFVGFLSDPLKYGIPQSSYLYLNDGKGKFTVAGSDVMNLLQVGLVTSASFTDLNNDGWPDLVVAGEWMPVKVFMNNKGKFTAEDIPHSSGLWQNIYTADVNGDGFTDILAGNWGHNTKLWAGKNGPCKLYVKDFDNNGTFEQVMCYTINGKQYPFLAKDELERELPVLKKAYLKYSDVAGKTVDYIFYDLFRDYVELTAENLASSCFLGDGKGKFTRIDLPEELQLAPVMSFTAMEGVKPSSYLAGGNFYGVTPYEGRYDALLPTVLSFDKRTTSFHYQTGLPSFDGEIRDEKWLNYGPGGKVLVIARNNRELSFFRLKNK